MKLSQFRYDLPLNLIAQYPTKKREDSRLMVVNRKNGHMENRHFSDLLEYYDDKDVFVVNNTKVFRIHFMFAQVFYFNWSKSTQTSV